MGNRQRNMTKRQRVSLLNTERVDFTEGLMGKKGETLKTRFVYTILGGETEFASSLIAVGTSLNHRFPQGETPLYVATLKSISTGMALNLIAAGA
jgi:hypothetical protein